MFVGHFAAGLAAKAAEPKAPLFLYIAASQFMDWGWSGLVLAGVEHFRMAPTLPGSPLDLYDMPWTHSLPGALAWSVAGGVIAKYLFKVPTRAAAFVGATVFSHWGLDLLVHRPDLEIWPGGPRLGFGLWNHPVPEMIVEMGILAVAALFWSAQRTREGRSTWTAGLFLTGLVLVQYISVAMPKDGAPQGMALSALATYLIVTGLAWLLDRKPASL